MAGCVGTRFVAVATPCGLMARVVALGWDGVDICRVYNTVDWYDGAISVVGGDSTCFLVALDGDCTTCTRAVHRQSKHHSSFICSATEVLCSGEAESTTSCGFGLDIAVVCTKREVTVFDRKYFGTGLDEGSGPCFKHILRRPTLESVRKIACGKDYCLLLSGGVCYGYGANMFGQLGIGRCSPHEAALQPAAVPEGVAVQDIATGCTHSALLAAHSGRLYTFGNGAYYKLGHGDDEHRNAPALVEGLQDVGLFRMDGSMSGVKLVACGAFHTIAVADGTDDVYGWGWNKFGNIGRNPAHAQCALGAAGQHQEEIIALPRRIAELDDASLLGTAAEQEVVKATCGSRHSALLTRAGRVIVLGQLGATRVASVDPPGFHEMVVGAAALQAASAGTAGGLRRQVEALGKGDKDAGAGAAAVAKAEVEAVARDQGKAACTGAVDGVKPAGAAGEGAEYGGGDGMSYTVRRLYDWHFTDHHARVLSLRLAQDEHAGTGKFATTGAATVRDIASAGLSLVCVVSEE